MSTNFTIPDGYHQSFRRLLPYMEAPLHNDPQVLQSLLIYLKLGGEKMARIAIDAFNMNQRMQVAEMRKQLGAQVISGADLVESDEEKNGEDDDSQDDDNQDDDNQDDDSQDDDSQDDDSQDDDSQDDDSQDDESEKVEDDH